MPPVNRSAMADNVVKNTTAHLTGYASVGDSDPSSPRFEDESIRRMRFWWQYADAFCKSIREIRSLRELVLPREPLEEPANYAIRLLRTWHIPLFRGSLEKLTALPFRDETTLANTENPVLSRTVRDMDGAQCDLTHFGENALRHGCKYGIAVGVLNVTLRANLDTDAAIAQSFQSGESKIHFKLEKPTKLLRLRTGRQANGSRTVNHIAFIETTHGFIRTPLDESGEESRSGYAELFDRPEDGEERFDNPAVELVTQFQREPDGRVTWRRWGREVEGSEDDVELTPRFVPGDVMPVAVQFFEEDEDGVVPLPLQSLMELQLLHFSRFADLSDLMTFNIPIPYLNGWTEDEAEGYIVSPRTLLRTDNPDAKQGFIQADASSLEMRLGELDRIQGWAQVEGVAPMIEDGEARTAMEVASSEKRTLSRMSSWVVRTQRFLENLLALPNAMVTGYEFDPEENAVQISNAVDMPQETREQAKLFLEMRKDNEVSHETFLRKMVELGFFGAEFDVDDEIEKTARERMENAALAVGDSDLGDEGEEDDEAEPPATPGAEDDGGDGEDGDPA